MFDLVEQPWTLLVLSGLTFLIIGTLRSAFPEKRQPWQPLIPLIIVLAAFGIDAMVATDREQIRDVVQTLLDATENEDVAALVSVIGPDYQDSFHRNRARLVDRIRGELSKPVVKKTSRNGLSLDFTTPTAPIALLRMAIVFEPSSNVAGNYGASYLALIRISFKKYPDGRWLANGIEIEKINMQSISWNQIPSIS